MLNSEDVPGDPQSWYEYADRLIEKGGPGSRDEAEALLRTAVGAGHGPSMRRLAEFLVYESGRSSADVDREAESLLLRAIDADVPGAANTLANILADDGQAERAEAHYRQALGAGDRNAPQNLAFLLHETGRDEEAFAILRAEAEAGDGRSHWILATNLRHNTDLWREIDAAFLAARPLDAPYGIYCLRPGAWRLDLGRILSDG
jgi:TPR repeat protein